MKRPKFDAREADYVPQILAFEAWDREKRRSRPFAGLKFGERCSDGSINLAARHWPHLLCWQWVLNWKLYRADERRHLLAFYRYADSWTLHLMRCGRLNFQRQDYDRMAALGPLGEGAPVIFNRGADQ